MEKNIRKPLQGVTNIIRFNWHFYLFAFSIGVLLIISMQFISQNDVNYIQIVLVLGMMSIFLTLFASWYIYDYCLLYELSFLNDFDKSKINNIANINAGFDEISFILNKKFPSTNLSVYDFYDEKKHTEVSIKRARKAYPPYPHTIAINTELPTQIDKKFDLIIFFLSAHEIRNEEERSRFFNFWHQNLEKNGTIVVVEHLRDLPNFIVYNIGFFHFLSKKSWERTFSNSNLLVKNQSNITPFLKIFYLTK